PAKITEQRKAPSATSPSPSSSWCWCPRVLVERRFFLTRLGTRGLSVRLFRRRAMRAASTLRSAALLGEVVLEQRDDEVDGERRTRRRRTRGSVPRSLSGVSSSSPPRGAGRGSS